jgi:hypothetical protein
MRTKAGTTLVEAVIVVAVFSLLGLLLGRLTESFVEAYLRLRDQVDLQRLSTSLVREIESGDDENFDGLRAALEILDANDRELSFVPQFRDSSQPVSAYLNNLDDAVSIFGPPRDSQGKPVGGLRIELNPSLNLCELRYYLARQPRAGSSAPTVYLRYDQNSPQGVGDRWQQIPIRYQWQPPENQVSESFVTFTGGVFPLVFDNIGSPESPVCAGFSQVSAVMQGNDSQLFPNPFDRPGDQVILYYHPETEAAIVPDQESLVAHLFIKGAYPDQADRFELDPQSAAILKDPDPRRRGIHDNSLVLYYRSQLRTLPSQASFINANLEGRRLQFPFQVTGDNPTVLSRLSYFNSRNTTIPIVMEEIDGRQTVPPELIANIGLVRFDLLALFGGPLGDSGFEGLSKRNFMQLVPLDKQTLRYTLHTNGSLNSALGFSNSNCIQPGGFEGDNWCRLITRDLPSGKTILLSQTLYISQVDAASELGIRGRINFIFRKSDRVYKVSVNFNTATITVRLKERYSDSEPLVDLDNPTQDRTEFPLENSQFINFTDLQPGTVLDEGFNYTSVEVYEDFLGSSDEGGVEFWIEVSKDAVDPANIEGFSLTFLPK